MISHDSSTPLYSQVEESLKKLILSGEYPPHSKLPSENELCQTYSVSRITVRKAINLLESSGLIYTAQGKGTFVKSDMINTNLMKIRSFGDTLAQEGYSGYTRINSYKEYVLDDFDKLIRVSDWDSVSEISLTGYSMEQPVVLYKSVIKGEYGHQMHSLMLELEKANVPFSTFDLYSKIGVELGRVDQKILAINANAELAAELKLNIGDAVLVLDSEIKDKENNIVERKKGFYRTDKYSFKIYREV